MAEATIAAEGATEAGAPPSGGQVDAGATIGAETTEAVASEATGAAGIVPDWPEDWRQKMAGKDEELLKRLKRFQSPVSVLQSWRGMEKRVSAGELKASVPFPANGDDAAKAAWRAENGVPAEPKGYLENLDGLVIGEADAPVIDAFAARMHGLNAPPSVVKDAVAWYYDHVGQQEAAQHAADEEFRVNTKVELQKEMGPAFESNIRALRHLLTVGVMDTENGVAVAAPDGLFDTIMTARSIDGRVLGNDPTVLRFLSSLGSYINPTATVAPSSGNGSVAGVADQIASIEKRIREDRAGYFKDEPMQKRYAELLAHRERMEKKTA